MEYVKSKLSAFHSFDQDTSKHSLPEKFNYPFCYEAHSLARIAAAQVQEYLRNSYNNEHNFGIDPNHEGVIIGKMFGVLVVKTQENELGFLAAYSGKLAQGKQHPYFVPPVYEVFEENGMYLREVQAVIAINNEIENLESDEKFQSLSQSYSATKQLSEKEIDAAKKQVRVWKKERQLRRTEVKAHLNPADLEKTMEIMKQESLKQQYDLRMFIKLWEERLEEESRFITQHQRRIDDLKEERKTSSSNLQRQLFENYKFLNAGKKWKSLLQIFTDDLCLTPPAGAGECAAPKLLQYAYLHNLQPVTMAEFWWGQSPKSEVRKHGQFYPACVAKCGPILGFMLQGLTLEENPLQHNTAEGKEIEVVFEDDDILLVNKPAEFLSVPGKFVTDSVQTRIKLKYPEAILVHRLDQGTSGIILIAKNYESYVDLQKQFVKRTVAKRYLAVLEGIVQQDAGIIDLPLRVDLDNRPQQMVCYQHGKPAQTRFEVQERLDGKTYIHFYPITGRTHQLRMHSAHPLGLNIPIVGDDIYGTRSDRLYLHAEYLEFNHPKTKERLIFHVEASFRTKKADGMRPSATKSKTLFIASQRICDSLILIYRKPMMR